MRSDHMFQPYDMRPTIEITAFTLTAISTVVVAIRLVCRVWVVNRLKLYDYIMCMAVICTWGLCVCNHYQLSFGSGAQDKSRYSEPKPKELSKAALRHMGIGPAASWYAYHIGYLFDLCLIKLSILMFYLSFATHRTFRLLVNISIGMVAIVSTVMIFLNAFQCPKDPSYALSAGAFMNRGAAHCFNLKVLFYIQAAFNMATDLIILILPLPLLLQLRMHKAKRYSLLVVFSIGLLVPIASGVRFWGLYLWANSGKMLRYYGGYVIFWSQVEINTAIICASAPSLQPVFVYIFRRLPQLQRSRDAYYYYGGGGHMTTLPSLTNTRHERRATDSIIQVGRPEPSYQPTRAKAKDEAGPLVLNHLTYEDVIRERVRAFAFRPSSIYSHTPSRAKRTSIISNV